MPRRLAHSSGARNTQVKWTPNLGDASAEDVPADPDHFASELHERVFRQLEALREKRGWTDKEIVSKGLVGSATTWNKWKRGSPISLSSIEQAAAVLGAIVAVEVFDAAERRGGAVGSSDQPVGGLMTREARIIAALVDKQLDDQGRADVLHMVQSYVSTFRGGGRLAPPTTKK